VHRVSHCSSATDENPKLTKVLSEAKTDSTGSVSSFFVDWVKRSKDRILSLDRSHETPVDTPHTSSLSSVPPVNTDNVLPVHTDSIPPVHTDTVLPLKTDNVSPVLFENFNSEYMQMSSQDIFDGLRLDMSRPLPWHPSWQLSHSLLLGSSMRESGRLFQSGPTYVDDKTVVAARVGSDGMLSGRLSRKLFGGVDMKCQLGVNMTDTDRSSLECGVDVVRRDWTTAVKTMWQGAWILNGSFSQVLTPKLQLGGDLLWVKTSGASIGTVGGRYSPDAGSNIFTGQITRQPDFKSGLGNLRNMHSLRMQHYRKVSDRLSLASEFEFSHPDNESSLKFGYEYTFRQARVSGFVDSGGRVTAVAQDYSGMGASGMVDHLQGIYKFGFFFNSATPPPETTPPAEAIY